MASQVYHSLDRALGPKLVDFTSHIQQNLIVSVPLTLALLSIVGWKLWNRNVAPLPPGPPRLPILGNLFDMPKEYDWLHCISLRSKFGPINSLTTLGQTIIILNSSSTITDLMEKRSSIYSDRPQMPFAGELVGWNAALGGTDAGELLKAQRRIIHRVMGTTAAVVGKFAGLMEGEARRFVRRVIERPEKLERFVRMCVLLFLFSLGFMWWWILQGDRRYNPQTHIRLLNRDRGSWPAGESRGKDNGGILACYAA